MEEAESLGAPAGGASFAVRRRKGLRALTMISAAHELH